MGRRSVTLVEVMVVLIIIGITATLGIFSFTQIKEKSLDREAIVSLKQMSAAERLFHMKNNGYYPAVGQDPVQVIELINENLKLYLPTGNNRNWDYACDETGCVQATRVEGDGRTWYKEIADEEPSEGTCPSLTPGP